MYTIKLKLIVTNRKVYQKKGFEIEWKKVGEFDMLKCESTYVRKIPFPLSAKSSQVMSRISIRDFVELMSTKFEISVEQNIKHL